MSTLLSVKNNNIFSENSKIEPNIVKNMFGNNTKIVFKNGLKSVDIPQHNFINFANKSEINYAEFVKNEILRLKNGNEDILTEYKEKWIGMSSDIRERLKCVFYETYYYKSDKLPYLKRLTKKRKPKFQLYYKYDSLHDIAEIVFIDLYHLLLPAANKQKHEVKAQPEKVYLYYSQQNDKIDIQNFL